MTLLVRRKAGVNLLKLSDKNKGIRDTKKLEVGEVLIMCGYIKIVE